MSRLAPASLDLVAVLTITVILAFLSMLCCIAGAVLLGGLLGPRWAAGVAVIAAGSWVISQTLQVARVTRASGRRTASCPPDSATILRKYPPRIDDAVAISAEAVGSSKLHRGANNAAIKLLRDQIKLGRELGAQVFAYHHGR